VINHTLPTLPYQVEKTNKATSIENLKIINIGKFTGMLNIKCSSSHLKVKKHIPYKSFQAALNTCILSQLKKVKPNYKIYLNDLE